MSHEKQMIIKLIFVFKYFKAFKAFSPDFAHNLGYSSSADYFILMNVVQFVN